ncbi:hypothetical protein EYB26_002423 [Talaromyces marneffei]|uniref:uncharacterized protein n=1 Tax=Talaromyces marneffei TaxID=37727 RepID=UPI0012A984DD|nr:uncharacterized protein EYB26_002423 [Talaromyces marneffei]QGA14767.1 hypothetical protein EYB26_002423 [Talaromyces marneffei]
MTASYALPYDLQDFVMANDDFLIYNNNPADNLLSLSNNTTSADQMDDLLWNFDYTNFAINDADSKLFDTPSYTISTENLKQIESSQCDAPSQSDHAMHTSMSSPGMELSSPSLTHSSSQSSSRSTSPVSEELPAVAKPKRKRSPVVNKAAHNKVEKRYRSNINAKFTALNNILPVSETVQSLLEKQDQNDEPVQQHRNKGEVLSEAIRYIKQLEERNRALEGEVRILKDNLLPRRRKN